MKQVPSFSLLFVETCRKLFRGSGKFCRMFQRILSYQSRVAWCKRTFQGCWRGCSEVSFRYTLRAGHSIQPAGCVEFGRCRNLERHELLACNGLCNKMFVELHPILFQILISKVKIILNLVFQGGRFRKHTDMSNGDFGLSLRRLSHFSSSRRFCSPSKGP